MLCCMYIDMSVLPIMYSNSDISDDRLGVDAIERHLGKSTIRPSIRFATSSSSSMSIAVPRRDRFLRRRIDVGGLHEPRAERTRGEQVVDAIDRVLAQDELFLAVAAVRAEIDRAVAVEHGVARLLLGQLEPQRHERTDLPPRVAAAAQADRHRTRACPFRRAYSIVPGNVFVLFGTRSLFTDLKLAVMVISSGSVERNRRRFSEDLRRSAMVLASGHAFGSTGALARLLLAGGLLACGSCGAARPPVPRQSTPAARTSMAQTRRDVRMSGICLVGHGSCGHPTSNDGDFCRPPRPTARGTSDSWRPGPAPPKRSWRGSAPCRPRISPARNGRSDSERHGLTDAGVEQAFNDGHILRTHVLRPTWHFVAPADIRWILELTAPRLHRLNGALLPAQRPRRTRRLARAHAALERALAGGQAMTRTELAAALGRAGVPAAGRAAGVRDDACRARAARLQRPAAGQAIHLHALRRARARRAAARPRRRARRRSRDRYFTSHGPATVRDFSWWSGLTTRDAAAGLDAVSGGSPTSCSTGGPTGSCVAIARRGDVDPGRICFPNYDEFLIAYRDRELVRRWPPAAAACRATVAHHLVIDGRLGELERTG